MADEERIEIVLSVVHEGNLVDVAKERPYDSSKDDFYAYDDTRELNYQVGEKEYDAARRVRSRLKSLLRKNEDLVVVIKPGPRVLTQEVIEVYDGLLDAEVTKIYFAASEEE
jgi:biopolymer transport protein ExbD